MKFKVGDEVIVTSGKDKGKSGKIIRVLSSQNKVVVEGLNLYTRHIKPIGGQAGQKVRRERPLWTASIAIKNDKGEVDRIGYQVSKNTKVRVYKKTGKTIPEPKKTK